MPTLQSYDLELGKNSEPQLGDERVGDYSRAQLLRMDADFCERMERAIARGDERREAFSPGRG